MLESWVKVAWIWQLIAVRGEYLWKGIITEENFRALMILYSKIGGHVLTPFLDTYLGVNEM